MLDKEETSTPENLVKLYNKYNGTQYDVKQMVCCECKKWLTATYYSRNKSQGLCSVCILRNNFQVACNATLPVGGKFPCKYHAGFCTTFETYENIYEHEKTCKMSSTRKCFCKSMLLKSATKAHLKKKHALETIELLEPWVNIKINLANNPNNDTVLYFPYHLSLDLTSLALVVSHNAATSQLNVTISNLTDITRNINYKAIFIHKGIEYSKCEKVFNNFVSTSTKDSIYISNVSKTLELNIYFDNYETIQPVLQHFKTVHKDFECPICMEIITDACYQCVYGHNVCINCKSMIGVCPTCRMGFNQSMVSYKRLTSNFIRPCKYAANGCFVHEKNGDIEYHERQCPMRKIRCDLCVVDFGKEDFIEHMTSQHQMQTKLSKAPEDVQPGFILYQGCVFEFNAELHKNELKNQMKIFKWDFRLIYSSEAIFHKEIVMSITYSDTTITAKRKISRDRVTNIFNVYNDESPIFNLAFLF